MKETPAGVGMGQNASWAFGVFQDPGMAPSIYSMVKRTASVFSSGNHSQCCQVRITCASDGGAGMGQIASRAFGGFQDPGMAPFIDLMNHADEAPHPLG